MSIQKVLMISILTILFTIGHANGSDEPNKGIFSSISRWLKSKRNDHKLKSLENYRKDQKEHDILTRINILQDRIWREEDKQEPNYEKIAIWQDEIDYLKGLLVK